jgi:hypothetical protein
MATLVQGAALARRGELKVMQALLLTHAERGIQHSRYLGLVCRAGGGELMFAGIRKGDPAGATVIDVEFAADQSGGLNAVDELAGRTRSDAQRAGEITDSQAKGRQLHPAQGQQLIVGQPIEVREARDRVVISQRHKVQSPRAGRREQVRDVPVRI